MLDACRNVLLALILMISFAGSAIAVDSNQTNNESISLLETTQNLSMNDTNTTTVIVLQGDSIQAAIESCSPGSIIEVHTGTYSENINVTKFLTIRGADDGGRLPVVDANENGSAITISADGVLLDNLTAVNSPHPSNEFKFVAGINVTSSNCTIKNCLAYNNSFGLCLSNRSDNNTLVGNKMIDNKCGVALTSSNNNILYDNILNNNTYGIMLGFSDNNDLLDNTIFGNKYGSGISMVSSKNNTLNGNNLSNTKDGFIVSSSDNNILLENDVAGDGNGFGIEITSSENNTVASNSLSNNRVGVSLDSSHFNSLLENDGIGNDSGPGIELEGSHNNTIIGNNFSNGDYGIHLLSSRYNRLSNNSFFGNKYNFHMEGGSLDYFDNKIDISNLVNGRPIYYLKDETNVTIDLSSNAGLVGCFNCTNIVVKNISINNVGTGIGLYKTNNSIVESSNITNITYGIFLYLSNDNKITSNTINDGEYGINIISSDNNYFKNNLNILNGTGIILDDSQNNTFNGNSFSNNKNGFKVSYSDNNVLRENKVAGGGNGFGIEIAASNNNSLTRNNLTDNYDGVSLYKSKNNTIAGNSLNNNDIGIRLVSSHFNSLQENDGIGNDSGPGIELEGSDNNNIIGNNFSNGDYGIHLLSSGYNRLSNNSFFGNKYNFHMEGGRLVYFENDIDISNLVNGQPIYYLKDKANVTIDFSSNAGLVGCFNCTNIVVRNISISNVGTGIGLYKTTHSIVESSNITNITDGIILYLSNDNKIMSNTIDNGEYGIKIISSNNNSLEDNIISDSLKKYIGYNALGNNTFSNNSKKEIEDASLFMGSPALREDGTDSYGGVGSEPSSASPKSSGHGKHKMPKTDVKSTIPAQPDDEDLKKLFGGIISFKPKIRMIVNETTDVTASIAPNNTSASKTIYAIKENDVDLVVKGFTISKWMRLSLQDPGKKFQIELLSHGDQKILGDVPATWRWAVTPKKEGKHRLILVATLLEEEENGDKEPIRDVDVQTELIEVIANENETIIKPSLPGVSEVGKGISSFIKEIVGLLTAIFGLIILYRKLKKGEGD